MRSERESGGRVILFHLPLPLRLHACLLPDAGYVLRSHRDVFSTLTSPLIMNGDPVRLDRPPSGHKLIIVVDGDRYRPSHLPAFLVSHRRDLWREGKVSSPAEFRLLPELLLLRLFG